MNGNSLHIAVTLLEEPAPRPTVQLCPCSSPRFSLQLYSNGNAQVALVSMPLARMTCLLCASASAPASINCIVRMCRLRKGRCTVADLGRWSEGISWDTVFQGKTKAFSSIEQCKSMHAKTGLHTRRFVATNNISVQGSTNEA